jgi:hypothetical protein
VRLGGVGLAVVREAQQRVRRALRHVGHERQRGVHQVAAEAGIGDAGHGLPALVHRHLQQHVVARARRGLGRAHPHHARGQRRHLEAQGFQGELEQQVLLETVAAAAGPHELVLHRLGVERRRRAQQRVDVVVGNVGRLARAQLAQQGQAGLPGAGVGQALEVGVEVGHGRGKGVRHSAVAPIDARAAQVQAPPREGTRR